MTACLSDEQLHALVDEPLETAEGSSIAAHVRACARCRARRDDLARTGEQPACSVTVDVGPAIASAGESTALIAPEAKSPVHEATTVLPPEDATVDYAGYGEGHSPDTPDTARPGVFGDYQIIRELARGGMGVVFQARQVSLNRRVALKMILAGQLADEAAVRRFQLEAEAAAHLEHPGIVPIYEVGQHAGQHYFSMGFVEGQSLSGLLAEGPLPPRRAAELMVKVATAIEYAHRRGVIHRDLKPGNILLDQAGNPRVTDFGLAKKLKGDSGLTGSGQIMGTPGYMPPEQARGDRGEVGPSADVYSLGATLYALLTGRPPFSAATPIETVLQVMRDEPVPPRGLNPSIPRDLETICLKCLHKEPQKRYGSAQELADDLVRYRDGSPIRARVTPLWERGLKWSRRRPVAALVLALGLAAFVGLTVGGILYQRSSRLREEQRNAWVLEEQNRGMERLDHAGRAVTAAELQKARVDLATFRQEIRAETRLQPMSFRIEEKQKSVDDRLRDLGSREAAEQRDREDREGFQRFRELRQEAQLYAAGFGVLVASDRSRNLRASAHAALAIYAQDPRASDDAWTLAKPLPSALTGSEKARVADDCYDLLLIRSQVAKPDEGLRILDRAARLRPKTTAAYHRRRAECLERTGDLAGRDRENREADRIPPVTALDFFLNGRELIERRRFADAVRPLNSALQADPDQTSAHLLLAVCDFNMKALSPARTSLTTCIKSHPRLVGLYLLRALVSGEEGNQALERLAQGHPDEAEAARLRQDAAESIAAAEDDYRRALALKPDDDLLYVLLTNRGIMWLRSNRLDDAVNDLEAAIQLKPTWYLAHATLAQLDSRRERLDAAAASFTRAIDCQPEPIVAAGLYRSRALLRAYRSDITPDQRNASLRDLEQAIRLEPDMARRVHDHVDRARLFFAVGQSPAAIAACDAALELIPDDAAAHRMRISALMELKRYDEVLASADAYIARGEPSADIFEIRGLAREARRDYAAASDDFHKALDLTPDSATVRRTRLLNLRGWAYQFADAPRLALVDFEESLRLGPDQGDALAGRALARIRLGDWRPAVADAEAAVRLATTTDPRTGEERQARAQALFNAARVYALAVEFAAQDVSRQGERAVSLYRHYRGRALDLLDEALKYAPDREYRDAIMNDPALRPLRRGKGPRLGGRYVGQAFLTYLNFHADS